MVTLEEARTSFLTEIISDDPEVRATYLEHFQAPVEQFAEAMAQAFLNWHSLDAEAETKKGERRAFVSAYDRDNESDERDSAGVKHAVRLREGAHLASGRSLRIPRKTARRQRATASAN